MAATFDEIELKWRGEEYRITPNFRLINRIEQDVSLAKLAVRIQSGDLPMSHVASVFTHLLNAAGVKSDPEAVYCELMLSGEEQIQHAVGLALSAFFPRNSTTDDVKKKPSQAE